MLGVGWCWWLVGVGGWDRVDRSLMVDHCCAIINFYHTMHIERI